MALTRITRGVIKPNENYDTHNIVSTGIVTSVGLDVNGNADISGSLSVGGVLTYEDVTSIDSIGIITARSGIDADDFVSVGSNIHLGNAGVITATSFVGDGSGLIGVASTDNIITGTAATFNTYPVDINAGMTVAGVTTFADNAISKFGSSDDLQIYHDGSTASILKAKAGDQLSLQADTIWFRNAANSETTAKFLGNGAAELYYDNSKKFESYNQGVQVYGAVNINSGNINIANNQVLNLGNSYGYKVYSDGTDSFLQNATGNLFIRATATETGIKVIPNGAVELYHNGTKRFETTSSGTLINGAAWLQNNGSNITANGLGVNASIFHNGDEDTGVDFASSNDQINFRTSASVRATVQNTGLSVIGIMSASNANISGDLDVDGHTNLDNVSIAGVATATTFSGSGASLTNLNASAIASGTVPTARLGSGTANNTTFLRGDSTFQTVVTDLVNDSSPQLGGDLDTNSHHIFLDDNHYVYFGAGNDLGLYSDGSGGFIKTDDLTIGSFTGGEKYIDATLNGAVEIYHNDVKALSTSSTGINVWGNSGNGVLDIYPTGSAVYAILNLHNVSGGSAYNAQLISNSGQSVYLGSGGTGEVVLRTGNSQNKVRGLHNGATELYYSGTKKYETTANGNRLQGAQQDLWGDVKFDNQTNSGMDLRWDESLNRLHFEQDNIKAVFGAGSDFEIFHDGTTNRFQSNGLKNFQFNPKDTDVGLKIIGDGGVELYYDGGKTAETVSGGFTVSGNLTATGFVDSSSDIKLKTNIKTIDNALDKVLQLRGAEYDRIDRDNQHEIGVIAQEVEKVIPEVVHGDETKTVSYGNIAAVLIEAIKEQNVVINKMKKEIEDLKG